jgi:hypothetical protein
LLFSTDDVVIVRAHEELAVSRDQHYQYRILVANMERHLMVTTSEAVIEARKGEKKLRLFMGTQSMGSAVVCMRAYVQDVMQMLLLIKSGVGACRAVSVAKND